MRLHRSILGTIPSVFVLVLVLASVPASAAVTHKYLSQLTGFSNPTAVAFDAVGDVYIVDTQAKTVDRFNSAGTPLPFSVSGSSKLVGTPSGSFEEPSGVAVNDENGDVYVSDGAGHVVDVFSSSGEYLSQLTGTCKTGGESPPPCAGSSFIPFVRPWGLAVDQSTHDLYVTDRENHTVDVFSSTGTYLSQFGDGVLSTVGESVATNDLTEDAYVGDSAPDVIYIFDSMGSIVPPAWAGAKTPAGSFDGGFVYVGIDPTTRHVYVADTSLHEVDEFGASAEEEYVGQLMGTPSGLFVRPQAVAVDPINGNLYVADESGVVDVFGPDILVPDVTIAEPVSNLTPTSVTLGGTVNPVEAGEATCEFEYGTSTAYGKKAECAGPGSEGTPIRGGLGEDSPVPVKSVSVTGLLPDTIYYYRTDATNKTDGQRNTGSGTEDEGTFTTPGPGIESESASDVASTSATLEATLEPHGVATSYRFEYDTRPYAPEEARHGTAVPVLADAIGLTPGEVKVKQHIQGLTPDIVYYYRVVTVGEIEVETRHFQSRGIRRRRTDLHHPDGQHRLLASRRPRLGTRHSSGQAGRGSDRHRQRTGRGDSGSRKRRRDHLRRDRSDNGQPRRQPLAGSDAGDIDPHGARQLGNAGHRHPSQRRADGHSRRSARRNTSSSLPISRRASSNPWATRRYHRWPRALKRRSTCVRPMAPTKPW